MITGKLTYKNTEYDFSLDGDILRLAPSVPEDKNNFSLAEAFKRGTSFGSVYLVGRIDGGGEIVMVPHPPGNIEDNIYSTRIDYVFEFAEDRRPISRASFDFEELNYIYKSVPYEGPRPFGEVHEPVYKNRQVFFFNKRPVLLNVIRFRKPYLETTSDKPFKVATRLVFDFYETKEVRILLTYFFLAKAFVSFLCRRTNPKINSIHLFEKISGTYKDCCDFYPMRESMFSLEPKEIMDRYFIPQKAVAGNEAKIVEDIITRNLYIAHLPSSHFNRWTFTPADFILVTAAFENEFKRRYPDWRPKHNGFIRLSDKLEFMGRIYGDIINDFGARLYKRIEEPFDYKQCLKRVVETRNDLAHGDMSGEFRGLVFLDIIVVEAMVYMLQLSPYGVDRKKISKVLKHLFFGEKNGF